MVSVGEKFILRKCLIDNKLGTNTVRFTNMFRIKDELWSISNTQKRIVDGIRYKCTKRCGEYWMELGTTAHVMKRLRYRISDVCENIVQNTWHYRDYRECSTELGTKNMIELYLKHVSQCSNCCQVWWAIFIQLFKALHLVRLFKMHVYFSSVVLVACSHIVQQLIPKI